MGQQSIQRKHLTPQPGDEVSAYAHGAGSDSCRLNSVRLDQRMLAVRNRQ